MQRSDIPSTILSYYGDRTLTVSRAVYHLKHNGVIRTAQKYYSVDLAAVAMRVNGVLTWLMLDQVGSTSETFDIK